MQRQGVVITAALMDRLIRGDESARALVKASTGLDDEGLSRLISTEDHDTPVGTACTDITHPPFAVPSQATCANRSGSAPALGAGQIWRHAEARKRLRGSALRLYPGLALDCAFGPGGACGGVEAPNWNACNPRCGNTILDVTQLGFLKDTADRIRSYLDDGRIGTTQRLLLRDQLNELTTAIADHESRSSPGHQIAHP